jgi:hypothetical protein
MVRIAATAVVALALMPVIWVSSVAWTTALTAGLVTHEVGRRIRRALG